MGARGWAGGKAGEHMDKRADGSLCDLGNVRAHVYTLLRNHPQDRIAVVRLHRREQQLLLPHRSVEGFAQHRGAGVMGDVQRSSAIAVSRGVVGARLYQRSNHRHVAVNRRDVQSRPA